MGDSEILTILKTDLQISSDAYNAYLLQLVTLSRAAISKEGITLSQSIEDGMLVEIYAAFLYRQRRENIPMPKHLRYMLNNRLFSKKAGE